MTRVSEVMDCINAIESKCAVASWHVNGIHIWPLVRIRLSIRIRDQDFVGPKIGQRVSRRPSSLLAGLARSIFSIFRLLCSARTWRGFSIAVLTKPSIVPGRFNIYSGPLQEIMQKQDARYLAIEVGNRPGQGIGSREPVLYLDKFWLGKTISFIYSLLSLFKSSRCQLPGLLEAGELLSKRFPSIDSRELSERLLIQEARFVEAYRLFFGMLLAFLRPRLNMIICYYSPLAMSFILAARRHHAVCADYQHGVQGRYHYAYGSWHNFPPGGYELLPDVFLNWSELDKKYIDQWAASTPHRSIVIGNLLADHVRRNSAKYERRHSSFLRSVSKKPLVLFTLGNTIPPEWIWDAIQDTSSEVKWLIRLHPLHQYLRQTVCTNLEARKGSDFEVSQASALPLPLVLDKIAVHVTGNSSVVLDALHSGKPSIVIDHYGLEYYDDLIASGVVLSALNPEQLKAALHCLLDHRPPIPFVSSPASRLVEFLESSIAGK